MKLLSLAVLLVVGCAHAPVQTSALPELDERPVLLASADVGTSVRDWYAAKLLQQPVDPTRPTFNSVTVIGAIKAGANSSFAGPLIITGNAQVRGVSAGGSFLDLSSGVAQLGASGTYIICSSGSGICAGASGVIISSAAASGSNAFQATVNGARIDYGAGASDYASSDGTTVTFAGPVAVTGKIAPTNGTTCTLNAASPSTCTAAVTAGATCSCSLVGASAAIAAAGCAVSLASTTLTVTSANGGNQVANIWCSK